MLLRFFRCFIYWSFNKAFLKSFIRKWTFFWYKFPKFISRCSALQNNKMSSLVIKKWPFQYNAKFVTKSMVFLSNFVYDFWRKMFLMLYSINWRNVIVWLLVLLEILGNMFIAILCFPVCVAINFEINLILLIKLFSYMPKVKINREKAFFIICKNFK